MLTSFKTPLLTHTVINVLYPFFTLHLRNTRFSFLQVLKLQIISFGLRFCCWEWKMSSSHERSQERSEERLRGKCPGSFYSSCLLVSLPHPWVPSTKPNYFPLTDAWLVTSLLKGCKAILDVVSFPNCNWRDFFFFFGVEQSSFSCFQEANREKKIGLLNGETALWNNSPKK